MRVHLLGLLLAALCLSPLSGCDDDSGGGHTDLSMTLDMAHVPDQAAGTDTCAELIQCAMLCTTPATSAACVAACEAKGTTAAKATFNAITTCAYAACSAADLGAESKSCNGTGTDEGSVACATCVAAEAQSLDCGSQVAACLSS